MTTMTDEQLAACRKAFEDLYPKDSATLTMYENGSIAVDAIDCIVPRHKNAAFEKGFSAGLAFRQGGVDELRALLMACRSSVKFDLAYYEKKARADGNLGPDGAQIHATSEAEAQRLFALLEKIDAATNSPAQSAPEPQEQHKFKCPQCGGFRWGTLDCTKPKTEWIGMCNTPSCGFRWHRATGDEGLIGSKLKLDDPVIPSGGAVDGEIAARLVAELPITLEDSFEAGSQYQVQDDDLVRIVAFCRQHFQAQAAQEPAKPKVVIELPDGDTRLSHVWWTEYRGDELHVSITVTDSGRPAPLADRAVEGWKPDIAHEANEWADMATNGIQWVKNIQDGISTPQEALAGLLSDLAHCREVHDSVVAAAPTPPAAPAQPSFEWVRDGIANAVDDWPHNEYWPPQIAEMIRAIGPTPGSKPAAPAQSEGEK